MAAILPFLETEQFHFPTEAEQSSRFAGLGSAGDKYTDEQLIAASNNEQTRLLWTRTLLQKALADKTFQLVRTGREYKIRLSEAFDRGTIPWARSSSAVRNVSLFSTNSKMRSPTFDLPAGAGLVGGTCPAAGPAQTTSIGRGAGEASILETVGGRTRLKLYPEVEFRLAKTVCSYCYATGGKYGEPSVQISELVRYAVVRAATLDAQIREALVEALVWQIPNLPFDRWQIGKAKKRDASGADGDEDGEELIEPVEKEPPEKIRERMAKYPNVVRVHSSGDFFDMKYAKMWVEVANRLYAEHGKNIILWAPTRTQVLDSWGDFWVRANVPPNFVIRPSAYHLGDSAPEKAGLSRGTSVLTPEDSAASKGLKFDHQCGVYDLARGNKTCVDALSPDGTKGCRACWVRPELRINYVAH